MGSQGLIKLYDTVGKWANLCPIAYEPELRGSLKFIIPQKPIYITWLNH